MELKISVSKWPKKHKLKKKKRVCTERAGKKNNRNVFAVVEVITWWLNLYTILPSTYPCTLPHVASILSIIFPLKKLDIYLRHWMYAFISYIRSDGAMFCGTYPCTLPHVAWILSCFNFMDVWQKLKNQFILLFNLFLLLFIDPIVLFGNIYGFYYTISTNFYFI